MSNPQLNTFGYQSCTALLGGADYVVVVNNNDGSASFFYDSSNGGGTWEPFQMSSVCCNVILNNRVAEGTILGASGHTYTWSESRQLCGWLKFPEDCKDIPSFNVVLNPQGNYGSLFYADAGETCYLNVKFDYLFQFDCQKLLDIQLSGGTPELTVLYNDLETQTGMCESLQIQLETYESTPFNYVWSLVHEGSEPTYICLTELGINTLYDILNNYGQTTDPDYSFDNWLNGSITAYDSNSAITTAFFLAVFLQFGEVTDTTTINYYTICNDTYESLLNDNSIRQEMINQLTGELESCNATINNIQSQIDAILAEQVGKCVLAIDPLERLDTSMSIDIQNPNVPQVVDSVYTEHLFGIGSSNLFTYLNANSPSGIYITGYSGVTCDNSACDVLAGILTQQLIAEANAAGALTTTTPLEQINEVNNLIGNNPFNSDWLHFETVITDESIISAMTNQYLNLSIQVNSSCVDFCILIDRISIDKVCTRVTTNEIFVTTNPSFDIQKVRDNKKSWIANEEPISREFILPLRNTAYDENHYKLVINTKELDLDVSIANAIETDVWCYITDNSCLLDPCLIVSEIYSGTCVSATTSGINFTGGTEVLPVTSEASGFTTCSASAVNMGNAANGYPNIFSSEDGSCTFIHKINNTYLSTTVWAGSWFVGELDGSISMYKVRTISGSTGYIYNTTNDLTSACCNAIGTGITAYNVAFGTDYDTFSWDSTRNQCVFEPIVIEEPVNACCCDDEALSGTNITGGTVVLGGDYSTGNTFSNPFYWGNILLPPLLNTTGLTEEHTACSFIYKFNATTGSTELFDGLWITGENNGEIGLYYNYTLSGGSATTENYSNTITEQKCQNIIDILGMYEGTNDRLNDTSGGAPFIFGYVYSHHLGDHFVKPYWDDECEKCKFTRCGDRCIDLDGILTSSVSGITTVTEFNDILTSELINARCRKTISGYPTLRLLYDRYMNSTTHCDTESSQFDYNTMSNFSSLIGTYWVDLIEQVIPSTSIWGANYIYGNTIFDAQKFKYRGYTLFTCSQPQNYPFNVIGSATTVSVEEAVLDLTLECQKYVPCTGVYIIQRDCGSEFIGSVNIVPSGMGNQQHQLGSGGQIIIEPE